MEPLKPLAAVFPVFYAAIPVWLIVIRCCSHLVILVGSWANILLMLRIIQLYHTSIEEHLQDFNYMAALLTCFCYSFGCLNELANYLPEYCYEFAEKQAEIKKRQESIATAFDQMIRELNTVLGQSLDSQVMLAERSLEAKRRDGSRLLQNILPKLKARGEDLALLEAFRNFVSIWLEIFAECSTEPVKRPYFIATEDELIEQCRSAAEVAEYVSSRMKANQIKLISTKQQLDKNQIAAWQKAWTLLRNKQKSIFEACRCRTVEESEVEEGLVVDRSIEVNAKKTARRWVTFGCFGFRIAFHENNKYPIYLDCCFVSIAVLSPEHYRLLAYYLVGLCLLCWSMTLIAPPPIVMGLMALSLTCISFVLYDFMEFDTVHRLEGQIEDLQRESNGVAVKRQQILDFYAKAQDLGELWAYRTLSRLELLKQLSEELEDVAEGQLVATTTTLVRSVGNLEQVMIPLASWLDKTLSTACKKQVAAVFKELTSSRHIKETMQKMPEAVADLERIGKQRLLKDNIVTKQSE